MAVYYTHFIFMSKFLKVILIILKFAQVLYTTNISIYNIEINFLIKQQTLCSFLSPECVILTITLTFKPYILNQV